MLGRIFFHHFFLRIIDYNYFTHFTSLTKCSANSDNFWPKVTFRNKGEISKNNLRPSTGSTSGIASRPQQVAVELFTDYFDTNIDWFHQKLSPLENPLFFTWALLNLLSYASTWPYAPNVTIKRQPIWSSFRWRIQNFFGPIPRKKFLRNKTLNIGNMKILILYSVLFRRQWSQFSSVDWKEFPR